MMKPTSFLAVPLIAVLAFADAVNAQEIEQPNADVPAAAIATADSWLIGARAAAIW